MSDKHRRRVKLLLLLGSCMVMAVGGAWAVYFTLNAHWAPMALNSAVAAIGSFALVCTLTDRLRTASLLSVPALFVVICTFCLFIDVPWEGVPRSVHMHLLTLAAAAILLFRGEKPILRIGLPLLCFATCLFFSGSNFGFRELQFLPPLEVRAVGVWINNAVCLVMLGLVMAIMQADVTARNAIEADLRTAVAEGHFLLHYQLQIGDDGRIIGAEALLRWQHPKRGLIPPGKFIPLAEETGLIVPIGDWVLRTACAQLVAWADDPRTAGLTLAVNVSASQFRQPDFVAQVLNVVKLSGVQPARLKLELTESMLVKDIEDVVHKMGTLQAHGVGFSLDDFGTGFSSLSYLKRLPLGQIKIDQSFVRDLSTDSSDMAIVRTLIALGKSLGLTVIAEGVETEDQHAWLRDNDCHFFQGYLFGRPVPLDQFEALVFRSDTELTGPRPPAPREHVPCTTELRV
ncbi:putative bifunctional diguanylate cyclase/phosphodiesterase [Aquabacterium sp.]|uniref:putative bifunctional diguanylate cyclase/phosphodiesterase n=1 Tax=Aquabacterium sp. TaxID=1872578 RepID=UPI003D6CBE8D